ncbi:MAG: 4Fe-4S dicluster domain-containing protein [Acidobacteria bacterium]|nr:4Fe-4S dicluster domain-containing protein [Acidobacteriota bacterium]MCB9397900.1 4Fe-4S dicluster domain-containing protein [Acidobacteriota bacterium]
MKSTIERRDFLALMGLTGAAATLGCNEKASEEHWKPWVEPVEGIIPYTAKHYATASRETRDGGLMVKVMDGRALKVEGNANHPVQGVGITARSQSLIQSLYGADRVKTPMLKGRKEISWNKARQLVQEKLEAANGKNVSALTGTVSGSVKDIWNSFVGFLGNGKHVAYEAFSQSDLVMACEKVFGRNELPFFTLEGVDYLVSMGTQFLETWGNPVRQAREYGEIRTVHEGHRAKHVAIEGKLTQSGANADTWLAAKPGSETVIALFLLKHVAESSAALSASEKELVHGLTANVSLESAASAAGLKAEKLEHLAEELTHAKTALVLPAESLQLGDDILHHHVAVLLLNKALGAVGRNIDFSRAKSPVEIPSHQAVADFVAEMANGSVDVLIIKDANPAYSLPSGLNFKDALSKVGFTIALADSFDETTDLADLVIPVSHELESWGEFASYKGVNALQQPVMRTRFECYQAEDLLIEWVNALKPESFRDTAFRDVLKNAFMTRFSLDESGWREALRRGGIFNFEGKGESLPISGNLTADFFAGYQPSIANEMVLVLRESTRYGDGRFANRGWMQELPDPMTGVTWDSFVEINDETAMEKGITYGDVLSVRVAGGEVKVPAMISSTIAKNVLCLETGQGHSAFQAHYNRGVNAFSLLSAKVNAGGLFGAGPMAAQVTKTTQREKLATVHVPGLGDRITTPLSRTQKPGEKMLMGTNRDRDIYRTIGLAAFLDPNHVEHGHHGVEYPEESRFAMHHRNNFYPDRNKTLVVEGRDETFYDNYKWEMNVDLSKCNGCSSCITACYAENNLPVMGKDQVAKGREMGWVRVNRYLGFREEDGEVKTEVAFMPMMCQQCGNAPCEAVCPSLATYHNKEGLNAMVYNRCVGTRYCANNCTYKARRFNWFDVEREGDLNWQLNPEVSMRGRGVMEKCTFCVQRLRSAKDAARDEGRKVADGEVMTACQQACPAQAISFGNYMDEQSKVHQLANAKHAYRALDNHLSTKPGVSYLKKITLSSESHA